MSSPLLIELTASGFTALAIIASVKALTSVLRTWIVERFRTRRLDKALEDSRPDERPEIILACGQLEETPTDKAGGHGPDGTIPADGDRVPPVLVPQDKRRREHNGD